MGDTGKKDDKFFQRVSLAWLAQDFGSNVDAQVCSRLVHRPLRIEQVRVREQWLHVL